MDDPIFDPWWLEAGDPRPPSSGTRWRSNSGVRPQMPPPRPAPGRPSDTTHEGELTGTAAFWPAVVVPEIESLATRLAAARHGTRVEDLTEASPPVIRLVVTPWTGPLDEDDEARWGVLELALEARPEEVVVARYWLGPPAGRPVLESSLPGPNVAAAWLERIAVDFLARLMALA